jgi:hypothetical protein
VLFLRERLGVKPVRGAGPSRRAFRNRPGVVLRTGIAGICSEGLGSKSSGRRRLRLELDCSDRVCLGCKGVEALSGRDVRFGIESPEVIRPNAEEGVATCADMGGSLEDKVRGGTVVSAFCDEVTKGARLLLLEPLDATGGK